LSSRELATDHLQQYKLIVLPYPLMMADDEANTLKHYVEEGGHLLVEARPGWVNEDGHAEGAIPGFGWTEMTGVRETSIDPQKEVAVKWGQESFTGSSFAEHFSVLDARTRVVAEFADGTPAGYEHAYGKGSVILLGTFAGQANEAHPVAMHPLGGILMRWAGLTEPKLTAPGLVELREMQSASGQLVFLFNHGEKAAQVEFWENLEHPAKHIQELISGAVSPAEGSRFAVKTEVAPQAVKIYRIDE